MIIYIYYLIIRDEYVCKLRGIFEWRKQAEITAFARPIWVEYLGHIVMRDGIKLDPKKVRAIGE